MATNMRARAYIRAILCFLLLAGGAAAGFPAEAAGESAAAGFPAEAAAESPAGYPAESAAGEGGGYAGAFPPEPALGEPAAGGEAPQPHTVAQGADRPLRSDPGDFDPAAFAGRAPPPPPAPALLVPANLDRALTRYYIDRNTRPNGAAWLQSVIRNGHTFIPFVREEIERQGLPAELVFVPFIESDYIGTALSRSGAAGLWQFMMNSIEPFGLRVTDSVDERRDFRRATAAALQKLEGHYRSFGCWAMALAAYNMGPNGLRRAAQRAGTFDYWELAARGELSRETTRFVPRIVAAAYVLTNSRRYGVDWWPEGVEWEAVTPGRPVSLDMIAAQTGADRGLLRRLNLELTHGVTPADPSREIVVPASHAGAIIGLIERGDAALVRYHRHRIQPGDTLYALARHHGVSVAAIEQMNHGIRSRALQIGQSVVIPILGEQLAEPFARQPAALSRPFDGTRVVSRGDTLWSLSRHYNVSLQELAFANNLELNQILPIGRALRVPILEE